MSATGRNLQGHDRFADDAYETPNWCTEAILPHLKRGPVFDPCCGYGAILDVVQEEWEEATGGYEIDTSRATQAALAVNRRVVNVDALTGDWPQSNVITNPPFSLAMEFIQKSFEIAPVFDRAFLLRLNFLGSQKRSKFHQENPCDIFVLSERPSFCVALSCEKKCGWGDMIPLRPDGAPRRALPEKCLGCGAGIRKSSSDACEYGWFCWGPGRGNRWFILPKLA